MKILLLVSPQIILKNQEAAKLQPPLGLVSIATYLSLRNWDVKIIDCYAEGFDSISYHNGYKRIGLHGKKIVRCIDSYKPNIIGIGCNFTNFIRGLLKLAEVCKENFPSIPIIVGGVHPTMDAVNIIKDKNIDIVVRGEGEKTLEEICERYIRGDKLTFVQGTVSKHNGKVIVNPFRNPIEPLDELPVPSYKHLKMGIYLEDQIKNRTIPFAKKVPVGFIVTSRGCIHNCSFCSTSVMFRKFRFHSPAYIVKEIKYLIDEYGIKEVAFYDDCFNGSIERVEKISNMLVDKKITIPWTVPPGLLIDKITTKLLLKMKRSGFYQVCFPLITGSSETTRYVGRPLDIKKAKDIVIECNKLGIRTIGNFIIGFPYETEEQIEETINYALNSDLDIINVYICQPHVGTKIYDIFKKNSWLTEKDNTGSNYFFTKYNTRYFKAEELNKIQKQFYTRFIKRRIYSFFTIRGFYMHIFLKASSPSDIIYLLKILFRFIKVCIEKRTFIFFK